MTVRLLSLGTAAPPGRMPQGQTAVLGRTFAPATVAEGVIETMYRRTRIEHRASVLINDATGEQAFYPANDGSGGPTTAARMQVYAREAGALGCTAARAALQQAKLDASRVTHVVSVSCTGFAAPGIDQALVHGLGLCAKVGRTHIGFMGCHGALNGIAVAGAIAAADPKACVLLCCVELCSLHMHYTDRVDQLIANALFADGAAAAVFAQSDARECLEVRACRSWLVPDTEDLMSWTIGDHGFEMSLSPQVSDRLGREVPEWIDSVLDSCGLRRRDVGAWAIHPGGPRIIDAMAAALGLSGEMTADTFAILGAHGNMSSPTVLFILERMLLQQRARPWVVMAFGPGLAAEAVVLG